MASTAGSDLGATLHEVLAETSGLTARQLSDRLSRRGSSIDKRTINSFLYRHARTFQNDGTIPPRWSLVIAEAASYERTPHRVASLFMNNWKAFAHSHVDLGGVTLLFGDNSSGKSSILQSLLLLKQSWGQGDLQLEGPHGSFGWYEHVVHSHNPELPLTLSAMWGGGGDSPDWSISVTAHVDPGLSYDASHPIARITCTAGDEEILLISTEFTGLSDPEMHDSWIAIRTTSATSDGTDSGDPRDKVVFYRKDHAGFPDVTRPIFPQSTNVRGTPATLTTLRIVEQVMAGASRMLESVEHIKPFRSVPQRDLTLGQARRSGYIARLFEDEGFELLPDVNEWLAAFEVPYVVELDRLGGEGEDEAIALNLIRVGGAGETVQLADVGFGVSQLLPIIVQLLASREKTILIEEPEAHLHPRLHSVMADLFVLSMQDYGNALVVETHSEAMLLRLQRRIAEGRIQAEETSIQHVVRDLESARILTVPIGADGRLDYEWPGGFFDDRMDDLVAILDPQPDE